MPNPIASPAADPYQTWDRYADDDPTCRNVPLSSDTTGPGAQGSASSPSSESGIRGPHAEAQFQDGDIAAEAFVLSGRDDNTGVGLDVFSASLHHGEVVREVHVAMARMGGSSDDGHFAALAEVFTAQVHAGFENTDGSRGFGASMGATVVGAEVTGTLGPAALTVGASVGSTVGASLGVRDRDNDGKTEFCGRVEFGVGTLGLCVEKWW
jgi:hypothetical protein